MATNTIKPGSENDVYSWNFNEYDALGVEASVIKNTVENGFFDKEQDAISYGEITPDNTQEIAPPKMADIIFCDIFSCDMAANVPQQLNLPPDAWGLVVEAQAALAHVQVSSSAQLYNTALTLQQQYDRKPLGSFVKSANAPFRLYVKNQGALFITSDTNSTITVVVYRGQISQEKIGLWLMGS